MQSSKRMRSSRTVQLWGLVWRFVIFVWLGLILGISIGIASNAGAIQLLPGELPGSVFPHLLVVSFFLAYPIQLISLLLLLLLVTVLSWLGHRGARSATQEVLTDQQRKHVIGRLKHSYQLRVPPLFLGATLLELAFATNPSAVQPDDDTLHDINQTQQLFPPPTTIREVYEQAQHELLILGEPGAGKSKLLIKLAQELLKEAEQDPTLPFPVVLPLSTWAQRKLPLEEWMSEQISLLCAIPPRLSSSLVEQEQILPFLDGLDEMGESERSNCIEAINTYRHGHPHPLIVCCRTSAYNSAARLTRLALHEAVVVLPLSQEQIEKQLTTLDRSFDALRIAIKTDLTLADIATTPLIFHLLLLIYRENTKQQFSSSLTVLQHQIWTRYVQYRYKGDSGHFLLNNSVIWLRWLARYMRSHNQTIFLLENVQPDVLPLFYKILYYCSVEFCLLTIYALSFGLIWGSVAGIILGIVAWFATGVILGFLKIKHKITPVERIHYPWKEIKQAILGSLVGWGNLGISVGIIVDVIIKSSNLLSKYNWPGIIGLSFWPFTGLVGGLIIGILGGLYRGLGKAINLNLPIEKLMERQTLSPNTGIRLSLQNGCLSFLLYSVFFEITSLLFVLVLVAVSSDQSTMTLFTTYLFPFILFILLIVMSVALFAGLLGGLRYGLHAVIQHYLLRGFLWRLGCFPYRAIPFLEEATQHALLYSLEGGYSFIHQLLLEYFADLDF